MSNITTVSAGEQKVFVREWTNGKIMLMSTDDAIKNLWLRLNALYPSVVELLIDPCIEIEYEDVEGAMPVIVDPESVEMIFSMKDRRIGFIVKEEDEDDE